jgi:F420H(2)-dependent quinone reductase
VASFYDNIMEQFASTRLGAWFFLNIATPLDRHMLKWSRGHISTGVGTRFNHLFVLLTSNGAKTGLNRTVPLLATFDGDDIILIASRGGYPDNPGWYHNLKKNPEAIVEHQGLRLRCMAHEAEEKERERLWRFAVKNYTGYQKYQQHTSRKIPVMVLKRINPV